MKKPWIALTCFGLFWSAITLVFDGFLGYGLINQLRAQAFAHTTGYVTHSEVTTDNSGDDGPTHGVDIRYHYEANGRAFEGDRFRYGAGSSSDSDWANRAVNQNREGAEITVYYNPSNPSESVLSPGVDASNLMMLLFMTPFNAVMFGFWFAGAVMLRAKFATSSNGGVKFFQHGQTLRIRLPRYPAFVVLLATTGLVGFIAIFPIAFLGGGFHPRLSVVTTGLLIAYTSGAFMFLRQRWVNNCGRADLIINHARQTVELPRTFGRKTKIQIPLSQLTGLQIDIAINSGESGSTFPYIPTLSWRNGEFGQGKLVEMYKESAARQFVDWLRPQLKLDDSVEKTVGWKSTMPVHQTRTDKT